MKTPPPNHHTPIVRHDHAMRRLLRLSEPGETVRQGLGLSIKGGGAVYDLVVVDIRDRRNVFFRRNTHDRLAHGPHRITRGCLGGTSLFVTFELQLGRGRLARKRLDFRFDPLGKLTCEHDGFGP